MNTGVVITAMLIVTSTDHENGRMVVSLVPGARSVRMVATKLMAPASVARVTSIIAASARSVARGASPAVAVAARLPPRSTNWGPSPTSDAVISNAVPTSQPHNANDPSRGRAERVAPICFGTTIDATAIHSGIAIETAHRFWCSANVEARLNRSSVVLSVHHPASCPCTATPSAPASAITADRNPVWS